MSGDHNQYQKPEPEPEVGVCCQDYDNCIRPCTPRGQWIAHVLCGCGDQIMRDDGAECGTCVTARNAVKGEWQGLTMEETELLIREAAKFRKGYINADFLNFAKLVAEVGQLLKEKNT